MTAAGSLPFLAPALLGPQAAALRSGELPLDRSVDELCHRLDALEPRLRALLPEPGRRERLQREAAALLARFPDPATRPPLFGVAVGIKDIIAVDGFPTRAGSALPPEIFRVPEAATVQRLRAAGALILGKTVTTEFAYSDPGATANPHRPDHTPGGSSSGSAAAVAAGYTTLALGSQTVGSVIRPAAFCGVVGFKPSMGRIPREGMLLISHSVDHVGLFTQDVASAGLAATILCDGWRWPPAAVPAGTLPRVAVPTGPYLEQVQPVALRQFNEQLARLEAGGCLVRRLPALAEIAAINKRHRALVAAEFATAHRAWFRDYGPLYRPGSAMLFEAGRAVAAATLARAGESPAQLRAELEAQMEAEGVDAWICPAALGPAPPGLHSTGDPVMNLPWTHSGLPALTLPAGRSAEGLPLGLQVAARFGQDEALIAWAQALEALLEHRGAEPRGGG